MVYRRTTRKVGNMKTTTTWNPKTNSYTTSWSSTAGQKGGHRVTNTTNSKGERFHTTTSPSGLIDRQKTNKKPKKAKSWFGKKKRATKTQPGSTAGVWIVGIILSALYFLLT